MEERICGKDEFEPGVEELLLTLRQEEEGGRKRDL